VPDTFIRTALGDIDPAVLGPTDYHEHLFQASPLLAGDELDDEMRSGEEASHLVRSGIRAMVDATPIGLGRDPAAVARIGAATGLAVIVTTGAHREPHYGSNHWLLSHDEGDLRAMFERDLVIGCPVADVPGVGRPALGPRGVPVRAGLLKAGIGYWWITPFEHRVLNAVAAAHFSTGAPVMVHLEAGSAANEVLDLLASLQVEPSSVVLAHIDRNPDPGLHAALAERGAYLGYDGMARHREYPDAVLIDCLTAVVESGYGDRILLGGDVARRTRYVAYGGMPGLSYLGDRFVPRVVARIGRPATDRILVENPARYLTWRAALG
jgi:phosphotriesterase-related protein